MQRILLIEDDAPFLEATAANLEEEGFEPVSFGDGRAALAWLRDGGRCDAILLDWYLPDLPGPDFLRQIRDTGATAPVMVLTAGNRDLIEDSALSGGAIDFVEKTRRFSILLKRLRLILKGVKQGGDPAMLEEIRYGDLLLFPKHLRARWKGQEISLTTVEYRIVEKLSSQPGTDYSYREIYDVFHADGRDGDGGYRVNVRSLIKRIRQKFREVDQAFGEIENYPSYGYRWRALDENPDAGRRPEERNSGAVDRHAT